MYVVIETIIIILATPVSLHLLRCAMDITTYTDTLSSVPFPASIVYRKQCSIAVLRYTVNMTHNIRLDHVYDHKRVIDTQEYDLL